ncbi:IMEF encapsulin system ferritin-like cargo protein [Halalkalibacter urbisdiaboli]|uniref:IMEF encapsulin system ferritin-like cargo protein n=1 Tax=Halalkalibacter urbisdiaboli TaxID=1960589 RepID=UPI000B4353D3|nr:IMEF encapsulin system ferritin-like cargo protein [Halalkalibacter urbisdiaboli]
MKQELAELHQSMLLAKAAIEDFLAILAPVIKSAQSDYERLYHRHIYDEEEERLGRVKELLDVIANFQQDDTPESLRPWPSNHFLQALYLETYGLRHFIEHLNLALYGFQDEERQALLNGMLEQAHSHYQHVKEILAKYNEGNEGSSKIISDNIDSPAFTVGSLL